MKYIKIGVAVVVLCLLIEGGIYFYRHGRKDDRRELTLYGNVDIRQVEIAFRVPGKLEKLFFEEGDLVKAGSLMAVLDKVPFKNVVNVATAHLQSAVAKWENAQIHFQNRLGVIESSAISEENLDDAQADFKSLTAQVVGAEAELALANDGLSYTEVYAPNDGIILTRIREVGSVLNISEPVYTLSLLSPVWVRAYVDEVDLGRVNYGMKAEVLTDGGKSYTGKVGFISPMAEFTPKTVQTTQLRTALVYRLRVYIDNPDMALKQGMPVTVKLRG